MRLEDLSFQVQTADSQQAVFAFDNNPTTSYKCGESIAWEVSKDIQAYTLLMNTLPAPVKCSQLDAKGKVVSEIMIDAPYAKVEVKNDKVVRMVVKGAAEFFEIIPHKK